MVGNPVQTRLIKKIVFSPEVCPQCNTTMSIGENMHFEEGVDEHLHSMIARRFCNNCYTKYGEKKLLK